MSSGWSSPWSGLCRGLKRHAARALVLLPFAGAAQVQASGPVADVDLGPDRARVAVGTGAASIFTEYGTRLKDAEQLAPLTSELFGDQVSLYSGQTTFDVVDIDIPGNNALPVQLRRRLNVSLLAKGATWDSRGAPGNPYTGIGDWAIDVPYITGIFDFYKMWSPSTRCSDASPPAVSDTSFSIGDLGAGVTAHIPGIGDKTLLTYAGADTPLAPYPSDHAAWTTRDIDRITCKATVNNHGQGFVLTTTEGITYHFDHYVTRQMSTLDKPTVQGSSLRDWRIENKFNPRIAIYLLATRVEDRHGNFVQYTYDETEDDYPTSIVSSDGRRIDLKYEITSLQDNGRTYGGRRLQWAKITLQNVADMEEPETRTWQYGYEEPTKEWGSRLTSVTLPDRQSTWTFAHEGSREVKHTAIAGDDGLPCLKTFIEEWTEGKYNITMTHPAGAKGVFNFKPGGISRAMGPQFCNRGNAGGPPEDVDVLELTQKKITYQSGVAPYQWSYARNIEFGCGRQCSHTETTVTAPDGGITEYRFSRVYEAPANSGVAEGSLLRTRTWNGSDKASPILREEVNEYVTGPNGNGPLSGYPFPNKLGGLWDGDSSSVYLRPLKKVTITQQGTTFVREHTKFDTYGRPTKTVRQGPQGLRKEATEYADREGRWVLGQILKIKDETLVVDGVAGEPSFEGTIVSNTYDSDWADLTSVREYGRLVREMTYRVGLGGGQ